ncbi:hypothetical protein [Spongiactinospora sp. TRM90649]|uniref:hypothetical protein n=1 Tax=Spongiactinospora sp. TRM90649 TaxID=3031114 RepID=UPI0023F9812F|nr:hypothetical protein [Spongiactinospora sp. TRM90649]MDF5752592.1 hypothetical protein [Spongiactinospora sp. TRM90649]
MDERRGDRPPYARRVWPPDQAEAGDALPPSARWYGTPADPHRYRVPRRLTRFLGVLAAFVAGVSLIAGAVVLLLRLVTPEPAVQVVIDPLAGIRYPLPAGWTEGVVAPVTAFTSVASDGGRGALVMARPGPALGARSARETTLEVSELYARLLLHGDTVAVAEDAPVAVAGAKGHVRAVVAQYKDVVNRPAYLRVAVLDRGGRTLVIVAMAQPDGPRVRADIDALLKGATAG